jgi:hypothetical protein
MRQSHGGKRYDLGDMYFRSSWEANYARYLNFLINKGGIIKWEFEPDTFEFHNIKRGNRFYTPDFKITNLDLVIEYHEIKGYMDASSKTKLRRMAKYYPEVKIVLIDAEQYKSIRQTVSGMIEHWEK